MVIKQICICILEVKWEGKESLTISSIFTFLGRQIFIKTFQLTYFLKKKNWRHCSFLITTSTMSLNVVEQWLIWWWLTWKQVTGTHSKNKRGRCRYITMLSMSWRLWRWAGQRLQLLLHKPRSSAFHLHREWNSHVVFIKTLERSGYVMSLLKLRVALELHCNTQWN